MAATHCRLKVVVFGGKSAQNRDTMFLGRPEIFHKLS